MKKLVTVATMATTLAVSPAFADTTGTYTLTGTVAGVCTITGSGTLDFGTLTDATGATAVQTKNPSATDNKAFCNQANTKVTVKRTDLVAPVAATSPFTNTVPVTSAAITSGQGTTITDSSPVPAGGTSSGTTGTIKAFSTVTVTASAGTTGSNNLVASTGYTGSVTIDLAPAN